MKLRILFLTIAALFVGGLRNALATANAESSTGTLGVATKLADAAHSYRHLLVKAGSDADHIALCGAADMPLGLTSDQPGAAEDPINVHLLGIAKSTLRMTCATALAANIDLYTAANGFVQGVPGVAGTYWKVGRARAAAQIVSSGLYIIEVEPCQPERLTVAATPASVGDIAAAFANPGLVKFL